MTDTVRKRKMSAEKVYIYQRNYRRIRDRALARLRQLHQEQYKQLLEEERIRDEAQGKKWTDITSGLGRGLGSSSQLSIPAGRNTPADSGEEASDDGGEA